MADCPVFSEGDTLAPTVVIGVGNELMRDDGVGNVVVRRLQEENLGPEVELIEGAVGGIDLIFDLEGRERAILVDAARMGLAPGAVRLVSREQIEDRMIPLASLHSIALHDVLELAEMSGIHPEITVVAVEPAEVLPGLGLSPAVEAAVPGMVRLVKELLARS
jgi:hydrogenase maturation protease